MNPIVCSSRHCLGDDAHKERLTDIAGRASLQEMTFPEFTRAILKRDGREIFENARDNFRAAFSTVQGLADLTGVVNAAILTGFQSAPDTTAGWVRNQPVPNYLAAVLATPTTAPRMGRVGRGETASSIEFAVTAQGWRLARFGAAFQIDDQDGEDTRLLAVYQVALEEIGKAARRLVPDLVYSLLLTNGLLDDGTAIFASGRGNYVTGGGSALAYGPLDTGMGAIAGQVLTDIDGDAVHPGYSAKYLLVPPVLIGTARRLVCNMMTGDGDDLIVRGESRLGSAGVVNPDTDEVVTGTNTNWLLASPAELTPGVVLGTVNGKIEPTIRSFRLDQGQWGIGFDVQLSLAATVLDPKGLYFATGA